MKVRTAKRAKAERGEAVRKDCIFGYMLDDNRKMVIDPEAAETVRMIFEMYANKIDFAAIEGRLYQEKRLMPSAQKKSRDGKPVAEEFAYIWNKTTILGILKNEQYLGTYISGKTKVTEIGGPSKAETDREKWIVIPGHHEAIVSQELFDAVQERFRVKSELRCKRDPNAIKQYTAQTDSALKGKVICGHCGHTMKIYNTLNAAFHCRFTRSAPDAACHNLRIPTGELEKVVLESIKRQAKLVRDAGLTASDAHALYSPAVADYEVKIEKLKDDKRSLFEALVFGDIHPDVYKAQKSKVEAELERTLQVYKSVVNECRKNAPDEDSISAAKEALRARTLQRELVDLLIDKVMVYPDSRIEVVWKLAGFVNCLASDTETCVAI